MPDPHWTSYVGMATGAVGAIAGIGGAVLGLLGYRKANAMKSLDLRIQLQKAVKSAQVDLHRLRELHDKALPSRKQILHTRGMLGSSLWTDFQERHKRDVDKIEELWVPIPEYKVDYPGLDEEKLEKWIVDIHGTAEETTRMINWYEEQLADDVRRHELLRDERKHKESVIGDVIVPPKAPE